MNDVINHNCLLTRLNMITETEKEYTPIVSDTYAWLHIMCPKFHAAPEKNVTIDVYW